MAQFIQFFCVAALIEVSELEKKFNASPDGDIETYTALVDAEKKLEMIKNHMTPEQVRTAVTMAASRILLSE